MPVLKKVRQALMENLWENYKNSFMQAKQVETALLTHGCSNIIMDHLAIIDLPSKHSGIPILSQIFSFLGYSVQGNDYLPDKQNAFAWLVEVDAIDQAAETVLPQIVVADFWLDELPITIKQIIEKYTAHIPPPPLHEIQRLCDHAFLGDDSISNDLVRLLTDYFSTTGWPLPTTADFRAVHEANELLAWVLAFGRRPNHFTIATHLLNRFDSLQTFTGFITDTVQLPLNKQGGIIKGSRAQGIEQSSTTGATIEIQLADGTFLLPDRFLEFVWRHAIHPQPSAWNHYFTGFLAQNANHVIESLYNNEKNTIQKSEKAAKC